MIKVPEEGFIFKLESYIVFFFWFHLDILIRNTPDLNEGTSIHYHGERKASRNLA